MSDAVERQVDAYNRRDLDAFLDSYAADAVIEDARGEVLMQGHEALMSVYGDLFRDSPGLHAEIATRIRVGEYIVDEEVVTGRRRSPAPARVVVIYHLAGDLIDHVRLIR